MKKYKERFARQLKWFSIAIFALIAVMAFATDWQTATGVSMAFALVVGGIELTGKEEALYLGLQEFVSKQIDKNEKGYISEQKMLDTIATKIKELNLDLSDNEQIKLLTEALEKQGLELQALKEVGSAGKGNKITVKDAVENGYKVESIKKDTELVVKSKSGVVEVVTIKAVGEITTANATTTTGGIALLDLVSTADRSIAQLQDTFVENYATVLSTNKPVVPYADYIPKEGGVTYIGEGDAKTQVDVKVEVRYAQPKKAGGYEILSDEVVQDIPQMQSFASTILFRKYLLKRQAGILKGDGLGDNPTGVTTIAAAFDPDTWTGKKVKQPNLRDVATAIANQIYITQNWEDDVNYMPNAVFVNPTSWFELTGEKTTIGSYVFPSLTLDGNKKIDVMNVIVTPQIPTGYILGGDFSKLYIVDYILYQTKQGYINDQFIKGMFTQVGEGRFFTYVKEYDKRAFVYDTIANVIAGIEEV